MVHGYRIFFVLIGLLFAQYECMGQLVIDGIQKWFLRSDTLYSIHMKDQNTFLSRYTSEGKLIELQMGVVDTATKEFNNAVPGWTILDEGLLSVSFSYNDSIGSDGFTWLQFKLKSTRSKERALRLDKGRKLSVTNLNLVPFYPLPTRSTLSEYKCFFDLSRNIESGQPVILVVHQDGMLSEWEWRGPIVRGDLQYVVGWEKQGEYIFREGLSGFKAFPSVRGEQIIITSTGNVYRLQNNTLETIEKIEAVKEISFVQDLTNLDIFVVPSNEMKKIILSESFQRSIQDLKEFRKIVYR